MPKGTAVGRIVHYVLTETTNHERRHEHRPAIIVHAWNDETVQLQVFTDASNDGPQGGTGVVWRTSVMHSDEHLPGTWHFPERIE